MANRNNSRDYNSRQRNMQSNYDSGSNSDPYYDRNWRFYAYREPAYNRYNDPWYAMDEGDQGDWYDYDYDYDVNPTWTYTEYWFLPGPYEGMGPSDYQRSDESIKEDINDRLTRHGRINARDIQVDVKDGEVTLKGKVHSRNEKRMAEDVADSVSGVCDVHNEIKIDRQHGQRGKNQKMQSHQIRGGEIHNGMDVLGKNGNKIGTVDEIRQNSFKVDRDMAKDVYVPFDQAQEHNGKVMLNVTIDQVDNQNWDNPDLFS